MPFDFFLPLSLLSFVIWLVLLLGRGRFWRCDQRLPETVEDLDHWPAIICVIPARDEAETIVETVTSIKGQTYPGPLTVFVVDDNSSDGTGDLARKAGASVIEGKPLQPGWTGKMGAVNTGLVRAFDAVPDADYVLLTDADIHHGPNSLKRLVVKAVRENRAMVSLMVLLRSTSFWEKLLIPAFVFFFQKLYPFPKVNNPDDVLAAAAGGCMLIRAETLKNAGGVEPIKGEIIDDCAMGRLIKAQAKKDGVAGGIWLGLTDRVHSIRPYDGLAEIWKMVTRTAFVQLDHSPFQLLGCLLGMAIIYVVPLLAAFWGGPLASLIGFATWALMTVAYIPTLSLYNMPVWRAFLLPVAALLYTLMTVDSARRHWQGQGGAWKGRTYSD